VPQLKYVEETIRRCSLLSPSLYRCAYIQWYIHHVYIIPSYQTLNDLSVFELFPFSFFLLCIFQVAEQLLMVMKEGETLDDVFAEWDSSGDGELSFECVCIIGIDKSFEHHQGMVDIISLVALIRRSCRVRP